MQYILFHKLVVVFFWNELDIVIVFCDAIAIFLGISRIV